MAKMNNVLEKRNQAFLIYQDENGIARVNERFALPTNEPV